MTAFSSTIKKNITGFSGGSAGVAGAGKTVTVTVTGTPEAGDRWNVRLGQEDFGYLNKPVPPVNYLLALGNKLYGTSDTLLQFSALDDATKWDTVYDLGAGFINMFNQFTGGEKLNALSVYSGKLAIFARRTIQLWQMDVDPARNFQQQVLDNIGVLAPKSVVQVGDVDVFFLGDTGVRSLRARNVNNVAFTADIGTPVDDLVKADVRALGAAAADCIGVIEPSDGRYWLVMGGKIYVFSSFPDSKVAAWSTYEPGFDVDAVASYEGRLWLRGADNHLYLYGGDDNATYDDCAVSGELPYLSTGTPATMKTFSGFDAVVEGIWSFELGTNPEAPDDRDTIGKLWAPSFDMRRITVAGQGTHFSIKFTCTDPGYARLSSMIVHYTPFEAG